MHRLLPVALAAAALPLFVWWGKMLAQVSSWPRVLPLVGVFLFAFAAAFYHRHFEARYHNEDVQSMALFLQQENPGPIMVTAPYMENSVRHYLQNKWAVQPLPEISEHGEGLEQTLKLLEAHAAPLWLVYTRPFHGDPGGKFKSALFEHGLVQKQMQFTGIELYQIK